MILYGKLLIGIYTQRNEVFSKAIVFIVLLLSKVQSFKNCFRILLLYCFHFFFFFFFFNYKEFDFKSQIFKQNRYEL